MCGWRACLWESSRIEPMKRSIVSMGTKEQGRPALILPESGHADDAWNQLFLFLFSVEGCKLHHSYDL